MTSTARMLKAVQSLLKSLTNNVLLKSHQSAECPALYEESIKSGSHLREQHILKCLCRALLSASVQPDWTKFVASTSVFNMQPEQKAIVPVTWGSVDLRHNKSSIVLEAAEEADNWDDRSVTQHQYMMFLNFPVWLHSQATLENFLL